MSNAKYDLEKELHKLIRDIPEVAKANEMYRMGILTKADAFRLIADELRRGQGK